MEETRHQPEKEGQICRIINPLADEDPQDVYVLVEDPSPYDDDDAIYVVNLRDLQHNIKTPLLAPQTAIVKSELAVIADNLQDYIVSWNKS